MMDNGFPMTMDDGRWTMDNAIAVAFSCLFQQELAQRFAPLDRVCKD
jgi:hypothetical protein